MSFILFSKFFDMTISILIILNIISTCIISTKNFKKKLIKNNDKYNDKYSKLEIFKLIIIIIYTIIITIIFMMFANKYKIDSYLTLLYYLSFIFVSIKLYKKNLIDLTTENKISYIQSTFLFLFFFSNDSSQIYLNTTIFT